MRNKIIATDPILDNDYFIEQITKKIGIYKTIEEKDFEEIAFIIDRGIEQVLDFTNRITIPQQLTNSLIEYIVNDYLFYKEEQESIIKESKEAAVKSISEGDTTVHFAEAENKQTEKLSYFSRNKAAAKKEWLSHRRLKWN